MELDWPTPVSCPPSLEWWLRTKWRTLGAKVIEGEGTFEWWVQCTVHGKHSRGGGQDTGVG